MAELEDQTENVCCLCNNGGELLSCDGPCRRSFHATVESGYEEDCKTLEMEELELDLYADTDEPFFCANCKHGQHQCFKCKALGNSRDNNIPSMEWVYCCQVRNCGKFYHLRCLGLKEAGTFICPHHKCHKENCEPQIMEGKRIIPCKLCPKAWHEACIPKDINFEEGSKDQRGWKIKDELTKKETASFVYCWDHMPSENVQGRCSYASAIVVQFPEQYKEDQINRRLRSYEKSWVCYRCSKPGHLTVEIKDDKYWTTCGLCGVGYWIEPSKNTPDMAPKEGGKCVMVHRPGQKRARLHE